MCRVGRQTLHTLTHSLSTCVHYSTEHAHQLIIYAVILLLGRVALGAQRPIVVKLSRERSVGLYIRTRTYMRRSVQCIVEKKADRIRLPFGIIGRTGPGMRQVVGFGDRSTGRGIFGGKFGARHCNQWGLYGVRVRQHRDAALFPNYFEQTCYYY